MSNSILERKPAIRTPLRKVIIAVEGKQTEKQYFEALSSYLRLDMLIDVQILASEDNKSAPKYVFNRLMEFKTQRGTQQPSDTYWMVIDRDRQSTPVKQFEQCLVECTEAKFKFAVSNPTFELWVLLHFEDVPCYDRVELDRLFANKKENGKRRFLEVMLSKVLDGYNKSKPRFERVIPYHDVAVSRSRQLLANTVGYPKGLGTQMHLVLEDLKG